MGIAARVDCFSENPTTKFGESLKGQIEERLKFVASGTKPRKNKLVMQDVIDDLKKDGLFYGDKVPCAAGENADAASGDESEVAEKKKEKKAKDSKKKDKKAEVSEASEEEVVGPKVE